MGWMGWSSIGPWTGGREYKELVAKYTPALIRVFGGGGRYFGFGGFLGRAWGGRLGLEPPRELACAVVHEPLPKCRPGVYSIAQLTSVLRYVVALVTAMWQEEDSQRDVEIVETGFSSPKRDCSSPLDSLHDSGLHRAMKAAGLSSASGSIFAQIQAEIEVDFFFFP